MKGSDEQRKRVKGLIFTDRSSGLITAAHELKTPLALVRQLALSLESQELSETERRRIVEQITLTSERALRLTADLSRTSRLEGSLFDLEPINPQQICEEVAHELAPLYAAKGRRIRVSQRRQPPLVVANRDLLRRIILNFGDNALHYGDSDAPVELRTQSIGRKQVRIGVRDYGPSVPVDVWRRLNEHIGTTMSPLHGRPQSSGLGLYIASQFADAMHGQIGATRHQDGATFYVDIDASTQLSLL